MEWNAREALEQQGMLCSFSLCDTYPPLEVGGEEIVFVDPVEVSGQAVADEREDIHVMAKLRTKLRASCARCLAEFELAVSADANETFLCEPDKSDHDAPVYAEDTLKLDGFVEQVVRLELPMVFICSPECQGLCPRCGQNRNDGSCNCSNEEVQSTYGGSQE